jgi:adenylylsulfate kinase-like enzyme
VRDIAREELPCFVEVWVKCYLSECIRRDPKGLYEKALAGEIDDLTGLQDPYEEPLWPEVIYGYREADCRRRCRADFKVIAFLTRSIRIN